MKKMVLALALGLTLVLAGGNVQKVEGNLEMVLGEAAGRNEDSAKTQENLMTVSTGKVEMAKADKTNAGSSNKNTVKKEE